MKNLLLALVLVLLSFNLAANYVRNQPTTIDQPDGTILEAFVTGDEFMRHIHDADGYTIVLNPDTGYMVYAVPDGNSIKPSDYIAGRHNPATLGIQPNLRYDPQLGQKRWETHQAALKANPSKAPTTGTINNLFVFVRFADQSEYTQNISTYDTTCNSTTSASMRGYFLEDSNNQLTVNTTFYPAAVGGIVRSFQDSHNRGYFLPYSTSNTIGYTSESQGWDRLQTMLRAAVLSISPGVPGGLDIDADDDGLVDNVCFVVQGSSSGIWNSPLWPHFWTLNRVSAVYINSKRVWGYNLQLSSSITMGVICHEMSHSIGFPDLYHYNSAYSYLKPVGAWDLMQWDQAIPQHHLTYMKRKYGGWFTTVPTITPSATPTTYTLTSIDQSTFASYRINSTLANEYYILEYRRKTGTYENSLPGSGLIIYRIISSFGGSAIDGNADGPPDEVYVYRPGGTITANGNVDNANFSSNTGRTALHTYTDPEPWLYSSTHTSLPGNLVITDVGASGGTTISFKVWQSPPNVWTGGTSTAWNTASNWSLGAVPNSTHWVEIPGGAPRYPTLSTTTTIYDLKIHSGGTLNHGIATLTVTNNVEVSGTYRMNGSNGYLYVDGDLFYRSGSTTDVTVQAYIYVKGNIEFSSPVNLGSANLISYGTSTSYIRGYANASMNNLLISKTSAIASISNLSTHSLTVNNTLNVNSGTLAHPYGGTTILKGTMNVFAGATCQLSAGTISFEGNANSNLRVDDAGNYLRNIQVNKGSAYTLTLSTNVEVRGNLTITSGRLSAGTRTITLGGNWVNTAGEASFLEGTSRVIFNGSGHQYCNYTENFNIIEVNKSGGALRVDNSTAVVTCAQYDWTLGAVDVLTGTFTANDLIDNGLFGSFYCNTNGTINLSNTDGYVDLNGHLYIYGGYVNIYGGTTPSYWPYAGHASITMSGGTLDFKDQGIYVNQSPTYSFTSNITGGIISVNGYFRANRADFNPTGGRIDLSGSADTYVEQVPGANFHNLRIVKTSPTREANTPDFITERDGSRTRLTRLNTVQAFTDLDVNGYLWLQNGTFNANSYTINVAGNWYTYSTAVFNPGTSTVIFDGSGESFIYNGNFNNLVLNKSGSGQITIPSGYVVTCATYDWTAGTLNVTGGTFTANDMIDDAMLGTITVTAGQIHFHQETTQYLDLRGTLNISGTGELHIYGVLGSVYMPFGGNATLNMSGGLLYTHDTGIYIYSGNTLTSNITGGTIRTARGFSCNRSDFNPSGGTVEFVGTTDVSLSMSAGTLHHVRIDKGARAGQENTLGQATEWITERDGGRVEATRANTLSLGANLICNGNLTVTSGTFKLNGREADVGLVVAVYGTVTMDNANDKLIARSHFNWFESSTANISAGMLEGYGNWWVYSGANVVIPAAVHTRLIGTAARTIYLASAGTQFGNLEIGGASAGSGYAIHSSSSQNMLVAGTLTISPNNSLNLGPRNLYVSLDLDLRGTLAVGDRIADIIQKPYFAVGSNLTIGAGTFSFHTSSVPYGTNLNGNISIGTGSFISEHHFLTFSAGATLTMSGGLISTPGIRAEFAGNFQPTGGTVIFTNNPASGYFSFWFTNGNWLPNFILNCNTGVTLGGDLTVKGDITFTNGSLDVTESNYNLTVGGYWINNVGGNAFNPRAGNVIFNKVGTFQNITGTNNFHNVVDLHSGNALDFQGPTSIGGTLTVNWIVSFQNAATINAVSNTGVAGILAFYNGYTSTIGSYTGGGGLRSFTGSHVIVNDLTQNGLFGSYTASNGHLEIHQDDSQWIDLNGPVSILNNGIIDLHGGNMACFIAYLGDVTFTMSSGQFNVKDQGINISLTGYDCAFNVTGGTIRSNGYWGDYRGVFNPSGGTVEFTGDNSTWLSSHASSWFHDLTVNKVNTRETTVPAFELHRDGSVTPLTRDGTLGLNTACLVNGTLTVEAGTLLINDNILTSAGNLIVNDVLKLSSGSVLQMGANRSLTVNSGGRLEALGSLAQAAVITRNLAGNYALNIESGGTLAAAYTIFEYMNSAGVNIKNGALVDASNSMNNCTFRLGAGGGTLLTVNNAQNITVAGAVFPTNIWGGAYNVAKTLNQGSIYFTGFSGAFSGPSFEQDSFFRVHWEGTGLPAITDLSITYLETYDRIRLNWSYTVPGVEFRIYKSLVPEGPWNEAGTTSNFTWNEVVPGNYHFYRVTAYTP